MTGRRRGADADESEGAPPSAAAGVDAVLARWSGPTLVAVEAYAVEARLQLADGVDPASVGAAVTAELCGHWEHSGACRFPHHNELEQPSDGPARLRTVYLADDGAQAELLADRIGTALRAASFWRVAAFGPATVAEPERELADRLLRSPRPPDPSAT